MGIGNRNKKRILIFSIIPVLAAVPFFTDDLILRLISTAILVIYVGFIIFLRDSSRAEDSYEESFQRETFSSDDDSSDKLDYETDRGEDFTIVSQNKDLEVLRADGVGPDSLTSTGSKSFFKPPDLKSNFQKIAAEKLPKDISHDEHFAFALERILSVIKEAYLAHTALFFWYNKKKQRLTLEKYASVTSDITRQKFEIENDVLSNIVKKEEPELLTDIPSNAETDIIRYYNKPQGIKSFVGVPLFYGESLAGVLGLDSRVVDAFGIETIYSLGRFVRVISLIISLFDEKFAESQSEQRLKAILDLLTTDKKFENESELYSTIEASVKSLIEWDVFTFVYFNPSDQKFKTSKISNKTSLKYAGENLEIDLPSSLVGKAIISGVPIKVDDTSLEKNNRFAKTEDVTFDGSFLAIPLTYDEQNYGVLCFESLKKNIYNNVDVDFMKKATKIFAYIVYSFSTQNILRSLLSIDVETKLLNYNNFMKELSAELFKSKGVKAPGALVLIKIDEFLEEESLFEGDPFPKVMKSVAQMIKEETTPQNLLGRLNRKVFGIYFFNSISKDVFLWAEKLRIKVARKPISVVSKQTTFTVSIGIASLHENTEVEELVNNAELALRKAIEKGGNSVKSI
ncbi:MAG: GAF domain-containing protein [Melioribacteraceae bacterium]|nr:GAF domain-containing protein [Melioribacteraceae bacterium]